MQSKFFKSWFILLMLAGVMLTCSKFDAGTPAGGNTSLPEWG